MVLMSNNFKLLIFENASLKCMAKNQEIIL
jgi:hypothetical protein